MVDYFDHTNLAGFNPGETVRRTFEEVAVHRRLRAPLETLDGVEENYDVELILPENFYRTVAGDVYFSATCAVLLHLVGLGLDLL